MKLPGADRATVEARKITDYLLSAAHPQGRFKAAFFERFGFVPERWQERRDALRRHAVDGAVSGVQDTPRSEPAIVLMARSYRQMGATLRCDLSGLLGPASRPLASVRPTRCSGVVSD